MAQPTSVPSRTTTSDLSRAQTNDAPASQSDGGTRTQTANPSRTQTPDLARAQPSDMSLEPAAEPYVFDLDGGRACLDFANTLGSSPPASDHLNSYADLVAFAAQSELITPQDAEWLRAQGEIEPVVAAGVLTRAKRLRLSLRALFSRLAAGKQLPEADLALLNIDLAASLSHARVVPVGGNVSARAGGSANASCGGGYRWGWSGRNLDAPLWPITRSVADLLTSDEERALVRECGADDCAWLFLDNTRNRSRQWCSMQSCGNREKARRHYARVRRKRDAPGAVASASSDDVARGATTAASAGGPRSSTLARRKPAAPAGGASAMAE